MSRVDRLLLWYPVFVYAIGFIFAAVNISAIKQGWTHDALLSSSFLAFVLFGNFAHNFVSFWQLFRIPEFRKWTRIYRWHRASIWQIAIATFAIVALGVFWLPKGFEVFEPNAADQTLATTLIFFFLCVNAHHNLAQFRGIGIGLTHRYQLGHGDEANHFALYRKREDLFYRFLLADWLIYFGWALFLEKPYWTQFIVGRIVFLFMLYAWMGFQHFKLSRSHARFKLLFHSRHLYRFFFGLHPMISFIGFGFHGADAMLTYWKSIDKSATTEKRAIKFEFVALYALIGVYFIWGYHSSEASSMTNRALATLFLTHYVVEGFMYRMKNPTTREHVGPLL